MYGVRFFLSMYVPAELTPIASMRGRCSAARRIESSTPSKWYCGAPLILGSDTTPKAKPSLRFAVYIGPPHDRAGEDFFAVDDGGGLSIAATRVESDAATFQVTADGGRA